MVAAILVLLLSVSWAYGQELAVVHYGVREGLPSSYITCLAQGPDGRLWIGHSVGVSSYDGREFRTWTPDDGLFTVSPTSILAAPDGRVWLVFPRRGLQYIEPDGSVRTVPDPSHRLVDDHCAFLFRFGDGSIMLTGHQGYYEVSPGSIRGPSYPLADRFGYVVSVIDGGDRWGRLFSTDDGVFRFRSGRFELLPLPYDELGGRLMSVMAFASDGALWALNSDGRLLRWESEQDYRIWSIRRSDGPLYPYQMVIDREGTVWVASGQGLIRFRNGTLESYAEQQGLSNSFIIDLLVDREDVFWIATESGLDKVRSFAFRNLRHNLSLPVNSVWTIEEVPCGEVWLGTNSGIITVDGQWHTKVWTTENGLPEESIVHIKSTPDGDVWILGYSGVHRWDGSRFISYPQPTLESLNLFEVLPVNPREIWICTSDGIYRLNPTINHLDRHPLNDLIEGSSEFTRAIPSKDGGIWLLGPSLYQWQPSGEIRKIEFPSEWNIHSIRSVQEREDRFLVLTDKGLAVADGSGWRLFASASDRQFFDFVEASDGVVWIGCNGGIARFDGSRFHFYGYYDGIALNECNTGAAIRDQRGVVWLGGVNVSLILPAPLHLPPPATPFITRVLRNGLETPFAGGLALASGVRTLEIHFAAPNFWNEQEQLFRFRLDGLDHAWSDPAREAVARYTSLPPGEYRFSVQCRPKNGEWTDAFEILPVTIEPAWWQTVYARVSFILSLVICGFFIGYVRIRRLKERQQELQRLVAEQTAEIKTQRDRMAALATTDEVTGLANRRKCSEALQREMARARRSGAPFSVFLFDIDFFKEINDSHGHGIGDEVLRLIARVGSGVIRETDTLGRWGGDEFILLMPETDTEQAVVVCRRLKEHVEREGVVGSSGVAVRVSLSGGIATHDRLPRTESGSERHLVRCADQALYRAKQEGRSRIVPASA